MKRERQAGEGQRRRSRETALAHRSCIVDSTVGPWFEKWIPSLLGLRLTLFLGFFFPPCLRSPRAAGSDSSSLPIITGQLRAMGLLSRLPLLSVGPGDRDPWRQLQCQWNPFHRPRTKQSKEKT